MDDDERTKHTGWQDPNYNTSQLDEFGGVQPSGVRYWLRELNAARDALRSLERGDSLMADGRGDTRARLELRRGQIEQWFVESVELKQVDSRDWNTRDLPWTTPT